MHDSALEYGKLFFHTYLKNVEQPTVVEIGSQNVNGALRDVAPRGCKYIGLDFVAGEGVDIVLEDPYSLPLPDDFADAVVTSSCFEHSQFFWLTFLEALRILKPSGTLYINAPSNGIYHRYPTDNWRFYPDAGLALNAWAIRSGYQSLLLECFIGAQGRGIWNDFVAVFLKSENFSHQYNDRISRHTPNLTNVVIDQSTEPFNIQYMPEDMRKLELLVEEVQKLRARLDQFQNKGPSASIPSLVVTSEEMKPEVDNRWRLLLSLLFKKK